MWEFVIHLLSSWPNVFSNNTFSHYSNGENVTQLTIKRVLPGLIHGYSIKLTGQMHHVLMVLSCLFMSYQRSVTENTSFFVLKFEIEIRSYYYCYYVLL